jgi:hypothetical protein
MQTSLMKTLTARALLRSAAGPKLAAGKSENTAVGDACRSPRPAPSVRRAVDTNTVCPLVPAGNLEVARHGR